MSKGKIFILSVIVVLIVGVAVATPLFFKMQGESLAEDETGGKLPFVKEEPINLSISCVGDIMVHSPQIPSQYDSATGTYDYNNNFEYVKQYISDSDLAICNVETTFAGGTYAGYPNFNAPETLADAIKNAGWDVAITANNHNMDTGVRGMKRTLEILRNVGLQTVGTRLDESEDNYVLIPVKGIQVAVLAYTYETANSSGGKSINGVPVLAEAENLLNTFSYATLDEDVAQMKNTIDAARNAGAEVVICYLHWGEEYQRSPNDYQLTMARKVADAGADMIFASHPHVVQGMEMLTNETTGKQVPVFYSLGNFISNQRLETLDNRFTEQGLIGEVNLVYDKSKKEITSITMDAIPVWVDKYYNGKDVYAVIPLDNNMESNPTLLASGHLGRAQQALEDLTQLLGAEYIRRTVPVVSQ